MGGGSWNTNAYKTASVTRAKSGKSDFGYHERVVRGEAKGIHESLDPKKVAGPTSPFAGQLIRESRDSDEHPNSLPIAICFDVTGSMRQIPKGLQKKLANLMDVVIERAGIEHPQVMVGAIGDSYSDNFPFQIGQFESDNRFDEQLRNMILEGHGGGTSQESYGLAYYFAAHHTHTDSLTERGKKGYFFTMGDELPYDMITAAEITKIFGIPAQADITIEEAIKLAQEKWEIFHLFSMDGSYRNNTAIHERWRDLLGQRVVFVDDSTMVCEIVAGIIHGLESSKDITGVISDIGVTGKQATVVENAISQIVATNAGGTLPSADTTDAMGEI